MKTKNYSPLYFLSALGQGGISISFFMYLMFFTNHKETPIPTFESWTTAFSDGNMLLKAIIVISIVGIIYFAFSHIKLMIWNINKFNKFKKSEEFKSFEGGNKAVQLMVFPLALAMTINVFFVLGAIFVPQLWSIIEYLFPLSLLAFSIIGIIAIRLFGAYISKLFTTHSLDFVKNNNLGQMLAIFAFLMIGVGFSASSAMSNNEITVILGLLGSTFFITVAIFFGVIKLILGMKSIFEYGLDKETSPTIWIIIPLLTLIGITSIRQNHGLNETFSVDYDKIGILLFITVLGSLQLIFGYIGNKVMKSNGYFEEYLNGDKKSPGSYALICPGVALTVFLFFFLHMGLVENGIVSKFGLVYFIFLIPIIYLQFITIRTMFKLNKKML